MTDNADKTTKLVIYAQTLWNAYSACLHVNDNSYMLSWNQLLCRVDKQVHVVPEVVLVYCLLLQ